MSSRLFHHTTQMTWFIGKQGPIRHFIWICSIVAVTIIVAYAYADLYPTAQERQGMAETMKNPAMTALVGVGYGFGDYTVGAMMAHQMLLFTAVATAIMNILFVTKHTRAEEEDGRMELLYALPIGRLSQLQAVVCLTVIINFVLALLLGTGLSLLRIDSMNLQGAMLYGAALGSTGLFFAGATMVLAQVSQTSRGTIGMALGILGISYLLRAVGDVGHEALSMASPLGWPQRSEVFVNDYWWPVILSLGMALVLVLLAFYLHSFRDLDRGFLPTVPGKKHGSFLLNGPFGLLLKLQRTSLLSWAVALFVLGVSYGSVLGDLHTFFAQNETMAKMFASSGGASLTDQFIAMIVAVLALIGTIPVLMTVFKLHTEEKAGRVEHLFSRAVSRQRVLLNASIIGSLTAVVMLFLFDCWALAGRCNNIAGYLFLPYVFRVCLCLSACHADHDSICVSGNRLFEKGNQYGVVLPGICVSNHLFRAIA
ncbi:ABC transporter permease [Virgibacillus halophilus]|uniref:ABC transporter permease n=1 Tax=Tigheibacillus halophilus TaxID=361280 RepID=A0ABU5C771_9BACI|nr:ABC transporter permease [Virgibacillus halophilus]